MSLISWITGKTSGIDLNAEQARGNALDAELAALNQEELASGEFTQAQFNQAEADRATGATGNVNQAVEDEFWAGWNEGASKLTGGIKNDLAGIVNGIWAAIPWQIIVLGLAALFLFMGGADLLRGILIKRKT